MRRNLFLSAMMAFGLLAFQNCSDQMVDHYKMVEDLEDWAGQIKSEIDSVSQLACNEDSDCQQYDYGYKACGGPQHWTFYSSSSTDVNELNELTEEYNHAQSTIINYYNKHLGGFSGTCEYNMGYSQMSCVDSVCQGSYDDIMPLGQ